MITPTRLPIVTHEGKKWYVDARLRQIRNVQDPHDHKDLDDFEMSYFEKLVGKPVRIVWKDEGRDPQGRSVGSAYAESAEGRLVRNYGWITWKEADETAKRLGVELQEV